MGEVASAGIYPVHLWAIPFLRKRGAMATKLPNPKYTPKPYEQMKYPGQRVQIDVKVVPKVCIVGQQESIQ